MENTLKGTMSAMHTATGSPFTLFSLSFQASWPVGKLGSSLFFILPNLFFIWSRDVHHDKFILTTHSSTHPLIRLSMAPIIFMYENFQINFYAAGWDVKKKFCIHHGMRKIQTDIYDSMAWVVRGQNFRFLGIFLPLLPLTYTHTH